MGWIPGIIGLILGIVAITRHKGKGMAAVAIVISLLGFIIGTAITLMSVAQADNEMSMKEALNIIFISCLVLAALEVVLLIRAKLFEKYGIEVSQDHGWDNDIFED